MTDHLDDDPNCDAAYDGEQCELALGHTGDHMSHNDDWPATVRDASRQAAGQPAAEPVDPTAAIEIWARMLCAADAHVYGGEHPTWQRLPSEKVRDDYRKAARWLLPRMTVSGYRPPADPTAAEAAPTNHDTEQQAAEQTARDDLYDALDQSWYRWDPQNMAKGTGIIRLINAYRAEVLREVAATFEAEVNDCPAAAGCPPCDVRSAFAARLRQLAAGAES